MNTRALASVRNAFLSGLLLLAPLAVTWLVFSWLVDSVGGGFKPYFFFFVPESLARHESLQFVWNILATVIVCVLVTALGYLSRYVLGRYFGGLAERLILNIPGVSAVYTTVKQIVETFGSQNRNIFRQVVLLQFPRPGVYSVGFVTSKTVGEPQARTAEEVWTVFVPTTPNPTTGYLVLVPRRELTELQMSVGDGMKMVISGGSVVPPWPPDTAERAAEPPAAVGASAVPPPAA